MLRIRYCDHLNELYASVAKTMLKVILCSLGFFIEMAEAGEFLGFTLEKFVSLVEVCFYAFKLYWKQSLLQ